MGLGTFKNTYVGAATQFFDFLKLNYEDYAPALSTYYTLLMKNLAVSGQKVSISKGHCGLMKLKG